MFIYLERQCCHCCCENPLTLVTSVQRSRWRESQQEARHGVMSQLLTQVTQ